MRVRFLKRLAKIIYSHPKLIIAIALGLTLLSAIVTITKLRISADYYDMISDSMEYKKNYISFTREFGDTEMIYVVIEADNNPQRAKLFADTLYKKLIKYENDIKKIFYRVDYKSFGENILLFLDIDTLKKLEQILTKYGSNIKMMAELSDLNDFLNLINKNLKSNLEKNLRGKVTHEGVQELKKWMEFFKYVNAEYVNKYKIESVQKARAQNRQFQDEYALLTNIIRSFIHSFERGDAKNIDFSEILTAPELRKLTRGLKQNQDGYVFTDNGKLLLMMILPAKNLNEMNMIKEPLRKMRAAISETMKEVPGVKAGITGRVVLQADEMNTSNNDMAKAALISLVIVTLLFMLFFKNLPRPILSTLSLIIAIGLTFGLTTITIGHLTILSIVFTVILIGLGIDFGVHILSRYKAELQSTGDVRLAIETTLLSTGKANITSAISISASFFAGIFTGFKGIEELGFIGGIGIILTFLCMITVLPAFLCLYDRNKHEEKMSKTFVLRFSFLRHFTKKPLLGFIIIVLITGSLFYYATKVNFNMNLTQLQADGLESVEYEHKLTSNSNFSSWFGAFIVDDIEKVKEYEKKLKSKSMVGEVHSILRVIPQKQAEKILLLRKIKSGMGDVRIVRKRETVSLLNFKKNIGQMIEYFNVSYDLLTILDDKSLNELKNTLKSLVSMLEYLDSLIKKQRNAGEHLVDLQKSFFGGFSSQMELFLKGLNPGGINSNNIKVKLPQDLLDRFVSHKGRFLIYAYSPYDLWAGDNMYKFVNELREIDKNVTGIAVLNAENTKHMLRGFNRAIIFSFIIVFIIVFIDFRNFIDSIFALIPMIFGILWLVIIMGIFKIYFNFANFFAVPILIGIGIENGVQMMHRFKEKADFNIAEKSTGSAVILTALTTIAGFGSLLIAQHKGVFSLGLVMTLGVFTCLLSTIFVLPVTLKLLYPKKRLNKLS